MKQSNEELVTLKAIRFEVDDLDLSIQFYRKLGCIIEKVQNSKYSASVYLSFSRNDTVLIHLFKDFRKGNTLTDKEKLPIFEIAANEETGNYHDEIFLRLFENGIHYSDNVNPEREIAMMGQFVDLNYNRWEIIDQSEINDID